MKPDGFPLSMIYYYLSNEDDYQVSKMGCSLVSQLNAVGCRAVVVSEGGKAPDRFMSDVAVVSTEEALARCRETDVLVAGEPEGYQALCDPFPCRAAYYETGTTTLPPPVSPDNVLAAVPFTGNEWAPVGFSISSYLYFNGSYKFDDVVAYPASLDEHLLSACREQCPDVEFLPVGKAHELNDAEHLHLASIYICEPGGRRLDLFALEAMAAACVVLCAGKEALPVGLKDDVNCRACDARDLPAGLGDLLDPQQRGRCARLREGAVATASRFRPSLHREYLRGLLEGPLGDLRS